jgi:hypothetical protein
MYIIRKPAVEAGRPMYAARWPFKDVKIITHTNITNYGADNWRLVCTAIDEISNGLMLVTTSNGFWGSVWVEKRESRGKDTIRKPFQLRGLIENTAVKSRKIKRVVKPDNSIRKRVNKKPSLKSRLEDQEKKNKPCEERKLEIVNECERSDWLIKSGEYGKGKRLADPPLQSDTRIYGAMPTPNHNVLGESWSKNT